MTKIVITQPMGLSNKQLKRLSKLGEVKSYDVLSGSPEEWIERCKDADIICTGKFGFRTERLYELKDKFISVPFVGTGFLDAQRLKERNIVVARSPGCNRVAVAEWIVGMMFMLFREFGKYVNVDDLPKGEIPDKSPGLFGKKVVILGKGNVGSRVGELCQAIGMKVDYFLKGDNLFKKVKEADVVVDALSSNPTTEGLLDKDFFQALKKGSYFITVTGPTIHDIDAMFEALDKGILAGVAHDSGGIQVGDVHDPFYQRLQRHPRVLATPHIAYATENTDCVCSDMMIDNIEAWLNGKPINLVG